MVVKECLLIDTDILSSLLNSKSMSRVFTLLVDGYVIYFDTYDRLSKRLKLKTRSASYKIVKKLEDAGVISHELNYKYDEHNKVTPLHQLTLNNRIRFWL